MEPEEWDLILAMLAAYDRGEKWNFEDPTTQRVLAKFRDFVIDEKDAR
jgi:hypothetical protein